MSGTADPLTLLLEAARSEPAVTLVALDYDGTLAPIVADPEQALPAPGTLQALGRLAERVGTLAIVTGRPAETVVRLAGLGGLNAANLQVRGAYGAERWDAGTQQVVAPPPPAAVATARARLTDLVDNSQRVWPGVSLEDKGRALAVHTRRASEPESAYEVLRPQVSALADELGLRFEPGRLVLEVRPAGMDKGAALRELVEERRARTLVYVGDDLGDAAAFAAVAEIGARPGYAGLRVGVTSAENDFPPGLVDLTVDSPAAVLELLDALTEALSDRPAR